jgi:hypothetical protein
MMNPYKGIIIMECEQDGCSKVNSKDVKPGCINCNAKIMIVDHGGKTLAELAKIKVEAPAPAAKASKNKK